MKKLIRKIGILSDIHGNYLALKAVLDYFDSQKCELIVNLGDIIDMAPHSARCLDTLLALENCISVRGNHDDDYVNDRRSMPALSHTPAEHKACVFDELGDRYKKVLSDLPLSYSFEHMGTTFTFVHYALADDLTCCYKFKPIIVKPTCSELDKLFKNVSGDIVFYGHRHEPDDKFGESGRKYVDVGSIGCHRQCSARCIELNLYDDGSYNYVRVALPYDRKLLKQQMLDSSYVSGKQLFDFYFDRIQSK